MKHSDDRRKEARALYIKNKVRDLTRLEKITGITRKTLALWRDEEKWDETTQVMDVAPNDIMHIYLRQEFRLAKEVDELEAEGKVPEDSTLKRLKLYRSMANDIKEQFDIAAMVLQFAEKYIDFVSGIPDFEGKEEYVKNLDQLLPKFMDYVLHGKK